jgi:hypothetical protein
MAEVECRWQGAGGSLGGLGSSPLPLLSGGGEVNGVDNESTAAMSGSGGVVAGVRVVGSTAG